LQVIQPPAGGEGVSHLTPGLIEFTSGGLPHYDIGPQVLRVLLAEPGRHPVRDWLAFLAGTAGPDVARRLERAGYLTQASSRWPRRTARWVPADPDCAFAPLIRRRGVAPGDRIAARDPPEGRLRCNVKRDSGDPEMTA